MNFSTTDKPKNHRSGSMILASFTMVTCWLAVIGIFYLGLSDSIRTEARPSRAEPMFVDSSVTSTFLSYTGFMLDTLYTLMPSFLEVNLDSQKVYQHFRDGSVRAFKVSTGTKRLEKGLDTREGIFVVQTKIEWLYSLQFDSTKVFNWLGFNYGIGFHSLLGWGYYRYLGKRPSSHGCIRMRRDDAEELYKSVEIGTPVMVHKNNYARVIAFLTDSSIADPGEYTPQEAGAMYHRQLQALYNGRKLLDHFPIIPLSTRTITHDGIPLGDRERVPPKQKLPQITNIFTTAPAERTSTYTPLPPPPLAKADMLLKSSVEEKILP
ncbi:MAG: L,D-transpeptidase [Chlorobi bacterium]|nr:L,D-transpeptidase [Chlorobiota bacterium]